MALNVIGILLLATLVEGTVEYLFGKVQRAQAYLPYISLVLGIAAAIIYKVDILSAVGLHGAAIAGYIISGIIIGRGSNYANDIVSRVRGEVPGQPANGPANVSVGGQVL